MGIASSEGLMTILVCDVEMKAFGVVERFNLGIGSSLDHT